MSTQNASLTANPSSPSLADLLAAIEVDNVSEQKRRELRSAIRCAGRALGRSLETVPLDARLLASRLKEVAPAAIGVSKGRWNNVRSLLHSALSRFQPMSPGRHRNDLLPQWLLLSKKLTSRSDQIALSRVLHFFSARAIGPEAVIESSFDEFRLDFDHSLRKTPERTFAPDGALAEYATGPQWDGAGRPNWIDATAPTDQDAVSTGCGVVYLYWMLGRGFTPNK
jgi:hypothetical protein